MISVGTATAEKARLIVVGIPAYNAGRTIASTILRARNHGDKIVVVDDGSTDDTAAIAEAMGSTVLSNPRNMGKGHAVKKIFMFTMQLNADVLVTIDADGQHDPADIPKIVEPVIDGTADLVVGVRTGVPRARRVAQKALDVATGVHDKDGMLVDSQSGFRAYSRKAISHMNSWEPGMGADSENLKKASQHGLVIKQIPINVSYGGGTDHTTNPLLHFSDILSTLAKVALLKRPLRYLGIPATLMVLFGLIRWIQILDAYNSTREFAIGNALVASVVLIAGFFLGIGAIILLAIRLIVQESQ